MIQLLIGSDKYPEGIERYLEAMRKPHYRALDALADGKPHRATSDNPLKDVWPDLVKFGLATRVEVEDKNKSWCYGVGWVYTITEEGQRIANVKQMELF